MFTPQDEVVAQSVSASDLINAVNALRASRGLSPYRVDSGLMSYAQQHAEYMASIQSATHTHSDGSIAWESGIQENVASGTDGMINSEIVVNQIWSDNIHMRVMVDFSTGDVGAGVGLGSDGNLYFVLNVIASDSTTNTNLTNSTQSVAQITTVEPVATTASEWIIPLVKSTPNAEGEIIHVVANGQSLWDIAIAYEVTIDDIRLLNNLDMDSTVINIGQELMIMQVTVQPIVPKEETTPFPAEVTERPTTTATSRIAATEILSAIVTETPMPAVIQEELPKTKNINFFHILITVSLIGLLFFSYFGFFRDKEKSAEENSSDN
jgi:LysM repeat protein